jgi:16S rRNA processing protein RimM
MPTPPSKPNYLLLGEILRPHGIRGEIRMRVLTDYPERIRELGQIFLADNENGAKAKPYTVDALRMHQGYALLTLKGVADRDEADRLRGLYALVGIEDAVPLEEGEFYLYQVIGLSVVTEDGERIGILNDVMETGANDVYIVNSEQYGSVLIPVIENVVLKTDIDAGTITVRLPEGLLPDR